MNEDINGKVIPDLSDFSIVRGQIFYSIIEKGIQRLGVKSSSRGGIRRRILWIMAITWLPLLTLSALQGLAFGDNVQLPFWKDFSTHGRFLIILPLLIFAESSVDFRLKELTTHFFKAGILDGSDLDSFQQIKNSITRLTNSIWADLIILVIIISNLVTRVMVAKTGNDSTWLLFHNGQDSSLSWAAIYALTVSMLLFQFVMFRWIWRWMVWFVYFRKLARLPLKLNPAHPDEAGGLGFLGFPPGPFIQVVFAVSLLVSIIITKNVYFLHDRLPVYYPVIGGFALFSILINVLPLLVFMKPLLLARRKGYFEYSVLIQDHHRQFDDKWLRKPYAEELPGIGDASSLTDFNTTFDVVRKMRIFPFDIKIMLSSIFIAILPLLPLFAFEYDIADLLLKVLKMLA